MKKYAFLLLLATACNSGETITKTEIEEPASTVIEYTPAPGQFINSAMAGFDTQAITTAADRQPITASYRSEAGAVTSSSGSTPR